MDEHLKAEAIISQVCLGTTLFYLPECVLPTLEFKMYFSSRHNILEIWGETLTTVQLTKMSAVY